MTTYELFESTDATHLLVQNEIRPEDTAEIMSDAWSQGIKVIYNPSPIPDAADLVPWQCIDWFVVNETELSEICNLASAKLGLLSNPTGDVPLLMSTLAPLLADGANIVCTLGSSGAMARIAGDPPIVVHVPAVKLQGDVRDTTGAGDCFTGYLVAGLMEHQGQTLTKEAMVSIMKTCVTVCSNLVDSCWDLIPIIV